MRPLEGQTALVTGASSGIGAQIAIAMGAAGAKVGVNYSRNDQGAEQAVQEITRSGSRAVALRADVSREGEVRAMFDALFDLYGRRLKPEDCEVWDCFSMMTPNEKRGVYSIIEHPGWCAALKPTPGSTEAIEKLRGIVDVVAVTSHFPTSRTWVHERDTWLKQHFAFSSKEIVHTSAKYLVGGDGILDDNPDHVTSWLREHPTGLAMLWHIPNTRKLPYDDLRVRGWTEVLDRVGARIG